MSKTAQNSLGRPKITGIGKNIAVLCAASLAKQSQHWKNGRHRIEGDQTKNMNVLLRSTDYLASYKVACHLSVFCRAI